MKININGFEAIEDGLNCAGIRRLLCSVVREPLHNAEKAIGRGSFFASSFEKTACIIAEKDIDKLSYTTEKSKYLNAAFVVIVLGEELHYISITQMYSMGIPFFMAENANDIKVMIDDGARYSELMKSAVAIYIPVRLLRSRQSVDINGLCRMDSFVGLKNPERDYRIRSVESKYNLIIRSEAKENDDKQYVKKKSMTEEHLIIGISGCAGEIHQLTKDMPNVSVCKLDMLYPIKFKEQIRKYSHVIIIGHGSRYVEEMLALNHMTPIDCVAAELKGDKLHEVVEISKVLKQYLPHNMTTRMDNISASDGILRVRKPTMQPITDDMCIDCIYRKYIKEIVNESPGLLAYEDIYCEKRMARVRSGMANADSEYSGDLVITNRKDDHYTGQNVRVILQKCEKEICI